MRKSCLLIAIVLPLLLVGVGSVALYRANSQYGLFEAPAVSHETLATADTRLRAVVKLDALTGYIQELLPPEFTLPTWVPFDLKGSLPKVLPQEVALLGGSNFHTNTFDITLFINERRGGPVIAQFLNEAQFTGDIKQVKWDEKGLQFQKRGVLTLNGIVPMPGNIEDLVLQHWNHDAHPDPIRAEGGHLFECTLDNRNGDALSLWATLTELDGQDFDTVLKNPDLKPVFDYLAGTDWLQCQVDLINPDALKIVVRLHAAPDIGPNIKFMAGVAMPTLQQLLRDEYKMKLNGDLEWRDKDNLVYGEFTLTGFRKPLLEALKPKVEKTPAAAEAPTSKP